MSPAEIAAPITTSPLLYEGYLYIPEPRLSILACYDAKTGPAFVHTRSTKRHNFLRGTIARLSGASNGGVRPMTSEERSEPEELLLQTRAGDQAARGRLLGLYEHYLALLARLQIGRRLQGKVDAADLVQETFLAAHRDWDSLQGTTERELVSWLRQILAAKLAKLVRHYLGTQRRDVRRERDLAAELEESSRVLAQGFFARQPSPSQELAHREQGVLLADALSQLPEDYREVVILRHLEGLSFPEVAQRMERSLDSVKKLWVRALDRLRRSLGGAP